MMDNQLQKPTVENAEAVTATVARLFAMEGNLLAVELLSDSDFRFDWYSHDNWDGGFDIYILHLQPPVHIFVKIGDQRNELEQQILDKLQPVLQGQTSDHVSQVQITPKITEGSGWRDGARKWLAKGTDQNVAEANRSVTVTPEVFTIPSSAPADDLVSVMMPFAAQFQDVYVTIQNACRSVGLQCSRADDIWNNATVIQDVFELIYRARIVIVDFSGQNPNVFYETGIAHALGRHVVPITQNLDDIPFDIRHHRALRYLANSEGLAQLHQGLEARLATLTGRKPRD